MPANHMRLEHVSFSYNRLEDEVCSSVIKMLLGHAGIDLRSGREDGIMLSHGCWMGPERRVEPNNWRMSSGRTLCSSEVVYPLDDQARRS